MLILEFDSGNTRLKWRLLQANCNIAHGFLMNDDWSNELPRLMGQIKKVGSLNCARASVVSGDDRFAILSSFVDQCFNVSLLKAEVKLQWNGVNAAYPDLGVDRWLAMLASHHLSKTAINKKGPVHNVVVNCGTGITIDLLDDNGHHYGGYILPGVGLMKRMLQTNTVQINQLKATESSLNPGTSTVECVNNGVLAMVVAMINRHHESFEYWDELNRIVYLTGGDGTLIQPFIRDECYYCSDLVMDGLALAFEDEAQKK